jgi:signal transduction histidine kinase
MKALGDAASELPWLSPAGASLVALTQPQPAWNDIRHDPGAVLLLLRANARSSELPVDLRLQLHLALQTALSLMNQDTGRAVAWNEAGCDVVYRHCLEIAALAQTLALKLPRCDAERAWIAGLLAPLGWLAVCAVDSRRIPRVLESFTQSGHQGSWQHQTWGLDHAALVRRLSRAWAIPSWLSAVIGHLGLPVDVAVRLGANPMLFQVVQLAVALRQIETPGLALPVGAEAKDLLRSLDLSNGEVDRALRSSRVITVPDAAMWKTPPKQQLLKDVLRLALDARAADKTTPAGDSGSQKIEMHVQKMTALAELAAGAGHEINNPLAVISGQAQYIARQLEQAQSLIPEEPVLAEYVTTLQAGIQRSLKTIRGQSQRIHNVLTNLMQFARPTPPQPRIVTVRELLRESVAAVQDLALVKKVRLACQDVPDSWRVRVDPAQTVAALTSLLRNAVEAAPPDGWTALLAEQTSGNNLKLIIEDNGPAPLPQTVEHMFDPFYSGRSAGRGQGLGLPIAWRLARQQGGEVSFDGHAEGITRFVLTLLGLESGYSAPEMNGHTEIGNGQGSTTTLHSYATPSVATGG